MIDLVTACGTDMSAEESMAELMDERTKTTLPSFVKDFWKNPVVQRIGEGRIYFDPATVASVHCHPKNLSFAFGQIVHPAEMNFE